MFETVSMPVYATMEMESANTTSLQVGATPRWTWFTSVEGSKIRTAPRTIRASWVSRSVAARKRLSVADSRRPRTLRIERLLADGASRLYFPDGRSLESELRRARVALRSR
jgi:hypothetical protein